MNAIHLEVLVEEPSMEAALDVLLAKLVPRASFEIHAYHGKSDLLAKLPARLAGYAAWITDEYRILVVVDRDVEDCRALKRQLDAAANRAGLAPRGTGSAAKVRVISRIAIEELEAWFFGDWTAVRAAYPAVPVSVPTKAAFRDPDAIKGGTWEAFERILQKAGYFPGRLAKIEAARAIAPHMEPARNASASFRALRDALARL